MNGRERDYSCERKLDEGGAEILKPGGGIREESVRILLDTQLLKLAYGPLQL